MGDFRADTAKWRREEMVDEDYENIEHILSNDALLEMGAICFALQENNCQESTFPRRVKDILENPGMHLEAAIYLTYNKSATLEKAQVLFDQLKKEKSFNAQIPSGLTISV